MMCALSRLGTLTKLMERLPPKSGLDARIISCFSRFQQYNTNLFITEIVVVKLRTTMRS